MKTHGGTKAPMHKSAPQNTSVGTAARPGAKAKHHIESSAPVHAKHLGRHVSGALR